MAPGYIWAGTLKWYFGYLAEQRGVDRQQVYDETAATTDLRRLPEPGEIADAVVFLASGHGPCHHRPVPGRQLRRVPPLSGGHEQRARPGGHRAVAAAGTCTRQPPRSPGWRISATDDYRDGLAVLLESYARDAGLTP